MYFSRQISNTQWKKYVSGTKSGLEQELHSRGPEPICSSTPKRLENKKTLGSPMVPNNPGIGSGVISSAVGSSKKQERKVIGSDRKDSDRNGKDKSFSSVNPQINGESKKIQNPKTSGANFGFNGKKINSGSGSGNKIMKVRQDGDGAASPSNANNRHEGISHSLERPRTKLKVSGGTQTTSDLHYMPSGIVHSDGEYSSNSLGRKYQLKSYSLNGPAAAQLSQSVRERIMQSPYSKVHMTQEYSPYASPPFYRERSPRIKHTDGSLSDSPYSNYADLHYIGSPYTSPYSWVARSNYSGSVASAPAK